jgi:uncharacterized repeat protein (TIGR01451 family)
MKVQSFVRAMALALALSGSVIAVAAPVAAPPKVVTVLSVDKTGPATPGDILTYTVTLRNEGKGAATGLVAMDPIPRGTTYVKGSSASPLGKTEYSIDGGKTWASVPLQVSRNEGKTWFPAAAADYAVLSGPRKAEILSGAAVSAGGGRLVKMAPVSLYSHVRWLLKDALAPGERASLPLKVKVG